MTEFEIEKQRTQLRTNFESLAREVDQVLNEHLDKETLQSIASEIEAQERRLQAMTESELVAYALDETYESQLYKDAVWAMQQRATETMFEAARSLCASEYARERKLGILADLGVLDELMLPFPDESVELLIEMSREERNQEDIVLESIVASLGKLFDERSIPTLNRYVAHPSAAIRLALARALSGLETDAAIRALIKLSRDTEGKVRNWATFALGTQTGRNTRAIREALAARLDDEYDDTRNEAIFGLAKRHDERAIEPLIRESERESPQRLTSDAALTFPHSRLLPVLLRNKELDIEHG